MPNQFLSLIFGRTFHICRITPYENVTGKKWLASEANSDQSRVLGRMIDMLITAVRQ